MHALDVLGDPIRRRILELLANGSLPSGDILNIVRAEFGVSQPTVSMHLKILRESGFTSVETQRQQRLYSVDAVAFEEVDHWLQRFSRFWDHKLAALDTELERGKRGRD